ncbi:DUF1615 family protein, partial [Escherichia coli]
KVYQLAEAKTGKSLPREMLPGIQLESPKITRNLTTAWFAKRVPYLDKHLSSLPNS